MKNFSIPPISTLIGSTLPNYLKVIRQGKIHRRYLLKFILSTIIVFKAGPFHLWENLKFGRKLKKFNFEKSPIFIIGHWRSGTTLLHNILCQDPEAGYLTTYHSVFPNNLGSKAIFKNFMKWNMPSKRPSDNVRLHIDYPQEDEFAVANSFPNAYYNFFYFPENYLQFLTKTSQQEVRDKWKKTFQKVIMKATMNTKGKRAVIKNPVNTFRVKELIELYPDARFIFIYRNPITVFMSSYKFFKALMPTLWFHPVSDEYIREMILKVYPIMMDQYEESKKLIPQKNLIEIKFENFEKSPEDHLKMIYNNLLRDDYEKVETVFKDYLKGQKNYIRNSYKADKNMVDKVNSEWGKYLLKWEYSIPEELDLI